MAVGSKSASKLPEQKGKFSNSDGKEKEKEKEEKSRKQSDSGCLSPAKRAKCPGDRIVGDRIYNSENGKTCHQCRHKTMDFVAACNNLKGDKTCTIKFCHKCLFNRYGEKTEEMALLEDWHCPKCRGICNCSLCRKKQGHQPTGILVHRARATGFSSVSELLHVRGPENFGIDKIAKGSDIGTTNDAVSTNVPAVALPKKRGKENSFCENRNSNLHPLCFPSNDEKEQKKLKHERLKEMQDSTNVDGVLLKETSFVKPQISNGVSKKEVKTNLTVEVLEQDKKCEKSKKQRDSKPQKGMKVSDCQKLDKDEAQPRNGLESWKYQTNPMKFYNDDIYATIPLPQGTELTTVAGIDLPLEAVGHALQFLEFCGAFEEILDLKEGEPEYVLQELIRGGHGCRGRHSPVIWLHIQLLSLIQQDLGEKSPVITTKNGKNSWLSVLRNCATRSVWVLKKLKLEQFGWQADDYDILESSKKLELLNFLCDQFLCTAKIRSWIEDQNSKFVDEMKEAKERVIAAKHKKKQVKQKMQDEVAKAIIARNGAPLSISEHEVIVLQIKAEAAQAHAEMLESRGVVTNEKQRSDAVRTEPIFLDVNGHAFWRLRGSSKESNLLLQDVGTCDKAGSGEKWFTYDVEQEKELEKYICSLRKRRLWSQKFNGGLSLGSSEADLIL